MHATNPNSDVDIGATCIRVMGRVQGVGYRPFVYRLARELGLRGWVRNDAGGVAIHAEGTLPGLRLFSLRLAEEAPKGAVVSGLHSHDVLVLGRADFVIAESDVVAESTSPNRIPPDRAICSDCRAEISDLQNRRYSHPFASCTECGPRYSILMKLPYDRRATSMHAFALCPACAAEYHDPADRRFHAQPIACPSCGPKLRLHNLAGGELATGDPAIDRAADLLQAGRILALKGLGGFQLLVRADDSAAVRRLRERKQRPTKPFAVMVASVAAAERIVRLCPEERRQLESTENPILLLERSPFGLNLLAEEVAPRLRWVGILMPTTPLHKLLLDRVPFAIVATSGNARDEPIVIDEAHVSKQLGGIADAVLGHDRSIVRRVDDSVIRIVADKPVSLRLARGFAPLPLQALENWAERHPNLRQQHVLAVGGQQHCAVALWNGVQAVLGPHVGDLDGPEMRRAFDHFVGEFCALYGVADPVHACDLHPDYFGTRWAAKRAVRLMRVQHHEAHACAAIIEHDLLDHDVLALTWDGTGFGPDGLIWGGEALLGGSRGFRRIGSLRPFQLPGGEAAIREPARVVLGMLIQSLGSEVVLNDDELLGWLSLDRQRARSIAAMIDQRINCPETSSVGRLFDAVAALVLPVIRVSYEGEAAVWLESIAADESAGGYPLPVDPDRDGTLRGDWAPLLDGLIADRRRGESPGVLASRFHHTLANWASAIATVAPAADVVLGGGCFQNRLLTERVSAALRRAGHRVFTPGQIPPGDGGLAAGQLGAALFRLALMSDQP